MNGLISRFRTTGSRAIVLLAVSAAALVGASAATAAGAPPLPTPPSYLFSIPSATGSLTGPGDKHLTLRLTGARDYLTRFTDRPLRQAFVVADVDFARRFTSYFAGSRPNAVLTYTPAGAKVPVTIVLTLGEPRWNARHHTWTFPATRIRKQPDNLPDTTVHITPPAIPNPRGFTRATLMIDDSGTGAGLGDAIFASGTLVTLADGSLEPMADVTVGQKVRSGDGSSATVAWIAGTGGGSGASQLMVQVGFSDGHQLNASPSAVLAGPNGGTRVADLVPGETVRTALGLTQVTSVTLGRYGGGLESLMLTGPARTFVANGVVVYGRGPSS